MALKLAIDITADATRARKGVGDARAALDDLAAHAQEAGAETAQAMGAVDAALDGVAATAQRAGRDAADAMGAQGRAAASAATSVRQLSDALRAANTNSLSSASAINARLGIGRDFGTAARAADIAAYGAAMDDVRAKLVSLYAAERQRRQALAEISDAARVGAISERERAAAVRLAGAAYEAQIAHIRRMEGALLGQAAAAKAATEAMVGRQMIVPDRAADIAAYGAEMDALRLRYSPLAAAAAAYRAEAENINRALAVGAISQQEHAAAMQRTRAAYDAQVASVNRLDAALSAQAANAKAAAQASVARQTITPDRAADIAAYGAAMDSLRAKYSPLYAAQRTYVGQLREIRDAQRAGALSAQEAAAAIERTKTAFAAQVPVLRAAGRSGGFSWSALRADQRTNLSYQANDVIGGLLMGQPLNMIAMQQGPQIVQALGGVGPTLSAIGSALTPVTLGLGGVTAALGLGASAWYSYTRATKDAAVAASSFGRGAGVTAGDIERSAYTSAAPAGLSVAEARQVAAELTRTGRIGSDQFAGLIAIAKDFAATLGSDVTGAATKLGEVFADPASGADQLAQMALLDGATARLAKSLAEQGDASAASQVMLEGLRQRLASSADATTALGRAWDALTRRLSNAWGAGGRWIAGGDLPLQQQLEQARKELAATTQGGGGLDLGEGYAARLRQRVAELERQLAQDAAQSAERQAEARLVQAGNAAVGLAQRSPVNAQLQEEVRLRAQIQRLEAGRAAPSLSAQEQGQITRAIEATRHALDGLANAKDRQADIDRLDLQIQQERDPVEKSILVATREYLSLQGQQITAADEAARVERARQKSLSDSAAAASLAAQTSLRAGRDQLDQLRAELSLIGATNAERARTLALLQARQQIRDQGITDPDQQLALQLQQLQRAEMQSRLASGQAADQALKGSRDQSEQLQAEISLIGASNAERARRLALLQAEQQIRQQEIDPKSDQAARIRSAAAQNADLTTRLAAAQAARQQWEAGRDQIEQLQMEGQLLGASSAARAQAVALLNTEQAIRRAGIATGSQEAQMLREQTARIVEQSQTLERRRDAWQTYTSSAESALDRLGDALVEHGTNWDDWRDTIDGVMGDVAKSVARLAITNPLKNALLGTNSGTLADLGGGASGGGLIGSLVRGLGGAASPAASAGGVGAAVAGLGAAGAGVININAGVVNVAGGLPGLTGASGLPGILGGSAGGGLASLASIRSAYDAELADPALRQRLAAITQAEVGGQGAEAQLAFVETLFNRGAARGMSLSQVISDRGYFPSQTFAAADRYASDPGLADRYAGILGAVRGGSNVSSWATGNASGSVGFAGGPQTYAAGGERFGVEGPDMSWAAQMRQQTQGLSTALGSATSATSSFGSGLGDASRSVATSLGGASGQIGTASTQLATATQQTAASATDFAGSIGSAISSLVRGIQGALSNIGGGVGNLLSGFAGGGTSLFAAGGIMTSAGPVPLRAYAAGGVATSPQLALFGEGATPEAYVPLPDGRRIPVRMTGGEGAGQATTVLAGAISALASRVGGASAPATAPAQSSVAVHNYGGAQVEARTDPRTGRTDIVIDQHVASSLRRTGSASQRALADFGVHQGVPRL
ncbi:MULTISPECIES: phage tail length tape measure family protein [unclassified Xanthobacter]|uniref:phage tail length tape measure family protein n=1 Tax=unclassified Xanthobacter TaxID=2623496 RepID=UPI001EE09764|nr:MULTISPECIES: phage tail length tape measure family protein [unclassified Xanthobacter]